MKMILHGDEAREKLIEGVNAVADAVFNAVAKEKDQRDRLEIKLKAVELDLELKSRELSEALSKSIQLDDDFKERLRTVERRAAADSREAETARADVSSLRRRLEHSEEELETQRKSISEARQRAREETLAEFEAKEQELRKEQERYANYSNDMRVLKQGNVALQSKLNDAVTSLEIAHAEVDAAKASSLGAISEGQTTHHALVQATTRLATTDSELAKVKAELL